MTWSDPSARQTGDLITAAIWNQDVVDNTLALRGEYAVLWGHSNRNDSRGDHATMFLGGSSTDRLEFFIPDNFGSLIDAVVFVSDTGLGTRAVSITTDYAAPGESYNNHSGSVTPSEAAVPADQIAELSFASALASLAAGDVLGVAVTASGASNMTLYGGALVYARD